MQIKAIDYWCNLFTEEAIKKNWIENIEIGPVVRWWRMESRARGYTPEEFLSILDEAGVEKVMIPAAKLRSYKYGMLAWDISIDEVADVIKVNPERYYGLAGIDPTLGMKGVRELEKAILDHNFIGAHLHTYGFGLPLNHAKYYPFYAKCCELDVPVVLQVGHSAEFMPSSYGRPILLDEIALDFPELRIVAAHTGWPWVEELIALSWKHPNVYIGTSAHAPKYWDQSLINFINSRGKEKVLYGTDYIVLSHKESLEQIEKLGLREESKRKLLRENALKVFKL